MMLTALLWMTIAGQQADGVPPPPPPPAKEKKICRTEETTGSRLGGRRVCRTKDEWDAIAADARKTTDDTIGQLQASSGG